MNKGKRKLHVTEFCLYMIWTFCVTAIEHHREDSNQVREDKSGVCQETAQAELAMSVGCLFHKNFLNSRPELRGEAACIRAVKWALELGKNCSLGTRTECPLKDEWQLQYLHLSKGHVEATLNTLVLRGGAFREWLSHEVIIITNGIHILIEEIELGRPMLTFSSLLLLHPFWGTAHVSFSMWSHSRKSSWKDKASLHQAPKWVAHLWPFQLPELWEMHF